MVREFYKEFLPHRIDKKGNVLPYVCVDGTYSQPGHHARFGVTFIIDCYTGLIIDVQAQEMCRECKDKTILGSTCSQTEPKFHGQSGDTEGKNAFVLFSRAPEFGFFYIDYVSDGDNKVAPIIQNVYPIDPNDLSKGFIKISKHECYNHAGKQLRGR